MRQQSGVTVLELFYALAIIAVLIGVGVPTFGNFILDARLTAQVNRFVHAIHLGKYAAHAQLTEIALCGSSDGTRCSAGDGWGKGWLLFANRDQDHPPQVDPGETVMLANGPFTDGNMTANRRSFVFRPFGIRSTNGTAVFCDRRGDEHARHVVISYTGRPRTVVGRQPGRRGSDCTS